jgi:hypothetical protein
MVSWCSSKLVPHTMRFAERNREPIFLRNCCSTRLWASSNRTRVSTVLLSRTPHHQATPTDCSQDVCTNTVLLFQPIVITLTMKFQRGIRKIAITHLTWTILSANMPTLRLPSSGRRHTKSTPRNALWRRHAKTRTKGMTPPDTSTTCHRRPPTNTTSVPDRTDDTTRWGDVQGGFAWSSVGRVVHGAPLPHFFYHLRVISSKKRKKWDSTSKQ